MAYLTVAQMLAALTTTPGTITPTVDRNVTLSLADTWGGYDGIRAQTGMQGGTNSDWTPFMNGMLAGIAAPLAPVNFNLSGHTSITLGSSPALFGAGPSFPFIGGSKGAGTLNWQSSGSGAILFTPVQGFIARDVKTSLGCVVLDLGAITTTVPLIALEGLYCDTLSVILRDGSIANGLTRKLNKLIFRKNWLVKNDRGLFVNGNGASRAWVSENHVDSATRFGICVGSSTPQPQQNGFDDFKMYWNNFVEKLTYNGANSNPFIMFGRYGSLMGNIVANTIYNGIPGQTNLESYYQKCGVCPIIGNIQVDGGAGQGMWALKGGGRTNADNSDGGWDYAVIGNVGLRSPVGNYIQFGFWIQCTDLNLGFNVTETGSNGWAHVNKEAGEGPALHLTNLMIHDNIHINRDNGPGLVAEGSHFNVWCKGNTLQGIGGTIGHRFATLSMGDATNYRMAANTLWQCGHSDTSRLDCLHVKTDAPTNSFLGSLPIVDNVVDVSDAPNKTQVWGLSFEGTGAIQNPLLDGNHFIGFADANSVVRNINSGGNRAGGVMTVLDNFGFVNDNRGTGTIPIGQASTTITHGLSVVTNMSNLPDPTDIVIQPTSVLNGGKQIRVTAITSTTFDVTTDAAIATNDFTFAWRVRKNQWAFV